MRGAAAALPSWHIVRSHERVELDLGRCVPQGEKDGWLAGWLAGGQVAGLDGTSCEQTCIASPRIASHRSSYVCTAMQPHVHMLCEGGFSVSRLHGRDLTTEVVSGKRGVQVTSPNRFELRCCKSYYSSSNPVTFFPFLLPSLSLFIELVPRSSAKKLLPVTPRRPLDVHACMLYVCTFNVHEVYCKG